MPAPVHIAVVAGATAPVLSKFSAVLKEEKRNVVIVALEIEKGTTMLDTHYYHALLRKTAQTVREQTNRTDTLWLSFWYYDIGEAVQQDSEARKLFFPFSCQVAIPSECFKKDVSTKEFVVATLPLVDDWFDLVEMKVISPRGSSPLLLPFRNFQSGKLDKFAWAFLDTILTKNSEEIPRWLRSRRNRFKEGRWRPSEHSGKDCFHNRRDYAFEPCDPRDPRVRLWLDGNANNFLSAWLRFGATIGRLHYDVQPPHDTVTGKFYHCNDTPVDYSSGRHSHLNIFPNDYIDAGG